MFEQADNPKDFDIIQQDHEDTLNEIGDLLIVLQDRAFKEGAKAQVLKFALDFMGCVKEHNGSLTTLAIPEADYERIRRMTLEFNGKVE